MTALRKHPVRIISAASVVTLLSLSWIFLEEKVRQWAQPGPAAASPTVAEPDPVPVSTPGTDSENLTPSEGDADKKVAMRTAPRSPTRDYPKLSGIKAIREQTAGEVVEYLRRLPSTEIEGAAANLRGKWAPFEGWNCTVVTAPRRLSNGQYRLDLDEAETQVRIIATAKHDPSELRRGDAVRVRGAIVRVYQPNDPEISALYDPEDAHAATPNGEVTLQSARAWMAGDESTSK